MSSSDLGPFEQRFGSARRPGRSGVHVRPPGSSDDLVEATGKLSEALEVVEHARGHLYAFHRLSGRADATLQQAVSAFHAAGQDELADDVERTLVGRDVIAERWTFELVEDYDANYAAVFREVERQVRGRLGFEPHVYEAEMKFAEQDR